MIAAKHSAANDPGKRWLTFLQNHRDVIAAFDLFTLPTVTFQLLYCVFVIVHGRRRSERAEIGRLCPVN